MLAQVEQVAPTDATILVQGETGTGKELVVHADPRGSRAPRRALVKIACAALPEPLLESELFGHERGAFTGAVGRKPGRFEVADGGTIFLDDVDTLPLGVQAKLLRAFQEGEVQRLGSNEVRRVDVRVVAATNRDLLAEVRAGRFREDLYYRLHVVPICTCRRCASVSTTSRLLVEHFVRQDGPRLGPERARRVGGDAGGAARLLVAGQRARAAQRDPARARAQPRRGAAPAGPAGDGAGPRHREPTAPRGSLADQVRDLKIRLIRSALDASGGNQRLAAERLGLLRQSLTRMIRDLGLHEDRPRGGG